jgi:phosphatidylserine synthase 1
MSRLDSECDEDSSSQHEPLEPRDVLKKTFDDINERPVDDISLEFFYKPHTISLLLGCIFGMTYIAFTKSNDDQVNTRKK